MKSKIITGFIILSTLATGSALAQKKLNTQKTMNMKNKATIQKLYDEVLNSRRFELLDDIVSADYKNKNQEKGPAAFLADIQALLTAFPDGKWKVTDLIAEDNRVVVAQEFSGTQSGKFQFIEPTDRKTVTPGMIIYGFENGKIISSKVETSQLKFFQDLGLLPTDITGLAKQKSDKQVALIDKITIPKASIDEVMQQIHHINQFIANLPGLAAQNAFERQDPEGNITLVTTAIWESQEALTHAREQVQAEFQRINVNPQDLFNRLQVKMERSVYHVLGK